MASSQMLLLLALSLQLLALVNCQNEAPQLNCQCDEAGNKTQLLDFTCTRTEDTLLSCSGLAVPNIPMGYSYLHGYGLYKLYRTGKDFAAAQEFCELEGARLAIPQDEDSTAFLTQIVANEPNVEVAYIGLTDVDSEGTWIGVDGNPAPYLPWGDGEIDNTEDADCAILYPNGTASVEECGAEVTYICERPINNPVLADYVWVSNAGRFWRYHNEHYDYAGAVESCRSQGAVIATPDTYLRAEELLRLLPADAGVIFTGLTDAVEEGVYQTESGRLLSDMEFQNWLDGQPNGEEGQNCVMLFARGYFSDYQCLGDTQRMVCEIVP